MTVPKQVAQSNILETNKKKEIRKIPLILNIEKKTLKIRILPSLRRSLIDSVGLMMTWYREKMPVSTSYILRFMPNLHKKSWMDSAVFMMISRLINSIAFYIVHSTKVFYCLPRKYGKYSLRNRWDTAQFPTAFLNKNHVLHCRGHIILGSLHDTVPSTLRAFV